ncbi:MAG: hypothetical protein HYU75_13045, partial [Betaproteobacteria bacterium]|nr:hypothetical protein [Betaproteobacteria bacterium]
MLSACGAVGGSSNSVAVATPTPGDTTDTVPAVGTGGPSGTTTTTTTIPAAPAMSGVAASGMPLSGATVNVLCATGGTRTATTDGVGWYSVDITGCTGPYVAAVSGTTGATQDGITSSAVSDAKTAITTALANVMTAAGVASELFDPLSTSFYANGTGWDRVLDNVKIEVTPAGIAMTNISAAKIDDMAAIANGSAAPD